MSLSKLIFLGFLSWYVISFLKSKAKKTKKSRHSHKAGANKRASDGGQNSSPAVMTWSQSDLDAAKARRLARLQMANMDKRGRKAHGRASYGQSQNSANNYKLRRARAVQDSAKEATQDSSWTSEDGVQARDDVNARARHKVKGKSPQNIGGRRNIPAGHQDMNRSRRDDWGARGRSLSGVQVLSVFILGFLAVFIFEHM